MFLSMKPNEPERKIIPESALDKVFYVTEKENITALYLIIRPFFGII